MSLVGPDALCQTVDLVNDGRFRGEVRFGFLAFVDGLLSGSICLFMEVILCKEVPGLPVSIFTLSGPPCPCISVQCHLALATYLPPLLRHPLDGGKRAMEGIRKMCTAIWKLICAQHLSSLGAAKVGLFEHAQAEASGYLGLVTPRIAEAHHDSLRVSH